MSMTSGESLDCSSCLSKSASSIHSLWARPASTGVGVATLSLWSGLISGMSVLSSSVSAALAQYSAISLSVVASSLANESLCAALRVDSAEALGLFPVRAADLQGLW